MTLESALPNVPDRIRALLLNEYSLAVRAFTNRDPGGAATHIGLLCEAAIRAIESTYAEPGHEGQLPQVHVAAWCKSVESGSAIGIGSSIVLARVISAAYTIRNRRGAGHTSAVDPMSMDAKLALAAGRWVLAELVRHQAALSPEDAQSTVDQLTGEDADSVFGRVAGHRYTLYLQCPPLQRPVHFVTIDALNALRSIRGIELLNDRILGYLYASSIHNDCDVDFWHGVCRPTVEALEPMAWLATFDGYESAQRARRELGRFPEHIRAQADLDAASMLHAVDHPPQATAVQAHALLDELEQLRQRIEELPRGAQEALDRLGDHKTRALVDRLKALLPSSESATGETVVPRGEYLSEGNAGFIFALCVYLAHRDAGLWRRVVSRSLASATWLADILVRPARGARFRAAAELARYPAEVRMSATSDANRADDETTRHIASEVRKGKNAVLSLILNERAILSGRLKHEVEQWALSLYDADEREATRLSH